MSKVTDHFYLFIRLMNEQNTNFYKIKSIISIVLISIGLGFFGFCISTQGECTSKILPNYVQLTGAAQIIKTGEQQIKQTVIQSWQQTNANYATNRIPKIKSSSTKQSTKSGTITEYDRVIKNLTDIIWDTWYATHITYECYKTARNPRHCVKSILGVSNAEWSQFKNCSTNNCLGLLNHWDVREYETVKHSITDWIMRYNLHRYNNDTVTGWLTKSRYCTSNCKYWWSNFQDWIKNYIFKDVTNKK